MPHRLAPGERYIGQAGLRERLGLTVPAPPQVSILGASQRRTHDDGQILVERYPASRSPGRGPLDDLWFAMRYEPLDLRLLKAAFERLDRSALTDWVRATPSGAFTRRAWFLFEWLTGERLDVPPPPPVGNVPALDPDRHLVAEGVVSTRHRVTDNLPGTPLLCPIVRRTRTLDQLRATDIRAAIANVVRETDPDVLTRAVSYLYTKETRSSFEIEREEADASRAARFVAALRSVREFDVSSEADFVRLQNIIVDVRFAARSWRDMQVFIGQTTSGYREVVHCAFPRPDDVPDLMRGLALLADRVVAGRVDPVAAAALVAFAFVFIHPFEDGNGRIHRYLIHRMLTVTGLVRGDIILPVSATMVRDRAAYDAALETFSSVIMPFVDWSWSDGDGGDVVVRNDTRDLYRFFDATRIVEYLYRCVIEAVQTDLREEVRFLDVFGRAMAVVRDRVDMPDRRVGLLVRLLMQGGGRLSARKRQSSFPELTDEEIAAIEEDLAMIQAGTAAHAGT